VMKRRVVGLQPSLRRTLPRREQLCCSAHPVRSPTLCDRGLAAPSRHFQWGAGGVGCQRVTIPPAATRGSWHRWGSDGRVWEFDADGMMISLVLRSTLRVQPRSRVDLVPRPIWHGHTSLAGILLRRDR
jgi:hypothetical protein